MPAPLPYRRECIRQCMHMSMPRVWPVQACLVLEKACRVAVNEIGICLHLHGCVSSGCPATLRIPYRAHLF